MMTVTDLLTVLSLIITTFSVGFSIGRFFGKSENRQSKD